MHALLHSVPSTLQEISANPHLHRRFMDTLWQVWVSLLWSRRSFLLGPSVNKVLLIPSKSLFSQFCVSSGGVMGALMVPFSKRAYAIPWSVAPRAPAACDCWPVYLQETLKHSKTGLAQSLWGLLVHTGFVWALWTSLVGMGFDSECEFAPPTILLGLLLCPWTWGNFFCWDPAFSCWWLISSQS